MYAPFAIFVAMPTTTHFWREIETNVTYLLLFSLVGKKIIKGSVKGLISYLARVQMLWKL